MRGIITEHSQEKKKQKPKAILMVQRAGKKNTYSFTINFLTSSTIMTSISVRLYTVEHMLTETQANVAFFFSNIIALHKKTAISLLLEKIRTLDQRSGK